MRKNASRKIATKPDADSASTSADAGVRVLCVDDHAVLVEGLKAQFAIEGGVHVVGHLLSADKLLSEVERLQPRLVLLDIEMPGPDIFETADRLHRQHPALRIVFLSAHIRDGYLAAAFKCGASGYFAKSDDLEHIVAGIKEVAKSTTGTFAMGPKVRERCRPIQPGTLHTGEQTAARPRTPLDGLTARELEVLRLIGKGLSRPMVAKELARSAKTIDGHQERMMKKLKIDSRAELMRFAIREGLAEA